jgi:hypothetical protein
MGTSIDNKKYRRRQNNFIATRGLDDDNAREEPHPNPLAQEN